MRPVHSLIPLLLLAFVAQSCQPKTPPKKDLPICGGIQVSLHTIGGSTAMNESVQISDHWQLSSVGRRHGWVRKLEPDEQRMLVKALQGFESLVWTGDCGEETHGVASTLTAKGSGMGPASEKQAAALDELLQKLISAKRIASR